MSVFVEPTSECQKPKKAKKKYSTKYNSKYRDDFPWAFPSSKGDTYAYCQFCNVDICIRTVGAKGLRDHGSTSRHTQKSQDSVSRPTETSRGPGYATYVPESTATIIGTGPNVLDIRIASSIGHPSPQNDVPPTPCTVYSVYDGSSGPHHPIYTQQKPLQMVNVSPPKRQVQGITFVSPPKSIQMPARPPIREERSKNPQFIALRPVEPQASDQAQPQNVQAAPNLQSSSVPSTEDLTCDICGKVFQNWIDLKKDLVSHIKSNPDGGSKTSQEEPKKAAKNKAKGKGNSTRKRGRPPGKKKTDETKVTGERPPVERRKRTPQVPNLSEALPNLAIQEYEVDEPPPLVEETTTYQDESDGEVPSSDTAGPNSDLTKKRNPFTCRACEAVFDTRDELKSHYIQAHNNGRPYECQHCNKFFTTKSHLEVHQKHKHAGGPNPCECTDCGRILSSRTNLRIHQRIHKGEKPWACHICNKAFNRKANLEMHIVYHTGERRFTCEVCGQSFFAINALKRHTKLHTGERDYACEICGATYVTGTDLRRHRLKHDDVKPFPCNLCDKQFTRSHDLKVHLRYHNKDHQFTCEVCNKQFVESGNFRRHMRRHTGERPYTCKICMQTFSQVHHYKVHLRSHDSIDSDSDQSKIKTREPNKAYQRLQQPTLHVQPGLSIPSNQFHSHTPMVGVQAPMQPITSSLNSFQGTHSHPNATHSMNAAQTTSNVSSASLINPYNSYIYTSVPQYPNIFEACSQPTNVSHLSSH